ncbi:ATP-binding protein [Variovorax sp. dw_954]|uniref:ATP-binding protein n=1 Tax=Variovorax sp. dw_954 TaxID=2720078 RepID=UPI001BD47C4D|nr:ATP-binding protein [Variovorax sp. dw_954]
MNARETVDWAARNQSRLVRAFADLRCRIAGETPADPLPAADDTGAPTAVDALASAFELDAFELQVLLLCAGVEMDPALAACVARAGGDSDRGHVTFSLALSVLDAPDWRALAPSAPLRRFRLVEMKPGAGVTQAELRIDERVLHYLAGVNRLDGRLEGLLSPRQESPCMAEEHWRLAVESLELPTAPPWPAAVLNLCGDDLLGQEAVAAMVARRAGRELFVLRQADHPPVGAELDLFIQLWSRESRLLPAFLLLQWNKEQPTPAARRLAERLPGVVMVASRAPLHLDRAVEQVDVDKPSPRSQRRLWEALLGPLAGHVPEAIDNVCAQFRLSADAVADVAAQVLAQTEADGGVETQLEGGAPAGSDAEAEAEVARARLSQRLWRACRSAARPALEGLAERIVPVAGWDDLVLPAQQLDAVRQLASQARLRMTVHERWDFAGKGRRGLGLSALFCGQSGTGKTLAAEVLATALGLDLYRVDLSMVVSKYIGETEKNLARIFDAADGGGLVLLFDEADALFGRRSEVKDSHDRFANIEVGYLLQRMEAFQGLAILTTNLRSSLDRSFQRRLRFCIEFPFPDVGQRELIWSRVFPRATPTRGLVNQQLAQLNMAGGNIRNIALNAAFIAAQAGGPVDMGHLLAATRMEATKTERALSEVEIRGWV